MPTDLMSNDDVFITTRMDNIENTGVSGTAIAACPIRGRIIAIVLRPQAPTNADITLTLSSKFGTLSPTYVLASAGAPFPLHQPSLMDRANYFEPGDAVLIASDGGGTGGGPTHIGILFRPA